MAPSWFQILIVIVLLVLLFGRGKISDLMGDVAKGIKSFKKGIAEEGADEEEASDTVKSIEHDEAKPAKTAKSPSGSKAKAS
ncbi:twin arginine translocase protein A [bacterium BMS3Bbin10]|nr:twin arginine translocase protein A [bacterium BMS3Bbin10]